MRGSAGTSISKNKYGADRALIYLFYACSICCIFLLKMTHCVECFNLLLECYVRKSHDATNFAGFSSFPWGPCENPVKCNACVADQNIEIECLSGFLGNAPISQEPIFRFHTIWQKATSGNKWIIENIWNLTEKIVLPYTSTKVINNLSVKILSE